MSNRKKLSLKTRFEVFKRDDFTCRYCGRKTPSVVLEVDHIIPVAEDGTNDPENLVTSCFECNRGKGAELLENLPSEIDIEAKTILLAEKERQLREYNEVKRQIREREDGQITELLDYWDDLAGGKARNYPEIYMLRSYLRDFAVADVMDAMDIAMAKAGDWRGCKYLSGIIRNKRENRKQGEED